ncbi:BTAD domain-containing putative transcriptional regulator [Pseudochelatococcus lubricantis]|nr:BTAD domain-containing putative transcriptional regulator [Pseudochelatococcus lubricantis]
MQNARDDSGSTMPVLLLLGNARIRTAADESVPLTEKLALLAGYLATSTTRGRRRGQIAEQLWPDRGEEQARGSLRNALSRLRAIGIGVSTDGDVVALAHLPTDIAQLAEAALAPVDVDTAMALSSPFLDGIEAPGSEIHDWLVFERARHRTLAQRALALASQAASERGEKAEALAAASLLLTLDPCRERSHRLLMRLHAAAGDRAAALTQFRACCEILKVELGVTPSEGTLALARELSGDGSIPSSSAPRGGSAAPVPAARPSGAARPAWEFRLSVAVLPFVHDEGDPDQRFLAEGIADDITTELTRHRDFLVIARPSSLRFTLPAEAARDLGVRYVVTGTLRVGAGKVSLSAGLVDEVSGRHLWAVRHEGVMDDFFVLRDRIVAELTTGLDAEIRLAERERAASGPPADLGAWELFHRGMWHAYHFEAGDIARAEACFSRASALAPEFALPHAGLAYAAVLRIALLMELDTQAGVTRGIAHASRAFELDPSSPFVLVMLGRLRVLAGDIGGGFDLLSRARDRHPSYAHVHYCLALSHHAAGEPALALEAVDMALRLSPRDPLLPMFLTARAASCYFMNRLEEAERGAREALAVKRGEAWALMVLALVLAETGRCDEARDLLSGSGGATPGLQPATIWPMIARALPAGGRARATRALALIGLPPPDDQPA